MTQTPAATATLDVAIVEDDRLTRGGLAALINGTPGYRCVAEYASVEQALYRAPEAPPQVLLLDIDLPGMPGSEGVPRLLDRFPGVIVLMLTIYDEGARVFESICNGASGYLLKNTPPARLLEAIREAAEGGAPMSPVVASKVVRLFRRTAPPARLDCELTPAQLELLRLLADGHSYQAAADRMGISVNTVRKHVRSTYDKLHVHSKSEAVSKALRAGIL